MRKESSGDRAPREAGLRRKERDWSGQKGTGGTWNTRLRGEQSWDKEEARMEVQAGDGFTSTVES